MVRIQQKIKNVDLFIVNCYKKCVDDSTKFNKTIDSIKRHN